MRLDVTIRNLEEIPAVLKTVQEGRVKAVDITHIHKEIDPMEVARQLREALPSVDIGVYLSAKNFLDGSVEGAKMVFRKKVEEAKKLGIKRLLFVSGHPRTPFDSLEMLRMANDLRLWEGCEVYCVYNPYFDPGRLREEQDRLRAKLAFPFVSGIALQIGMDTEKLRKGAEQIRSIRPDISLCGSVPVPNDTTLERLKENGIYGVFLPNSYLLSKEMAEEMTTSLLQTFRELKIEPIVFADQTEDIPQALKLFK
jgi:hypothetical protein